MMKAMVCTHYGPPKVLTLEEVAEPVPDDNEVLTRIYAAAVTSGDCRCRGFAIPAHFSILTRLAMRLAFRYHKTGKTHPGSRAGRTDMVNRGTRKEMS